MQNHTVHLRTLRSDLITLQIPIDYTFYEVKKQAFRFAARSHIQLGNNLEVFVNRCKVSDLTRHISELARDRNTLIEMIQKEEEIAYQFKYQSKCQLLIGWNGVLYNVTVHRNANIGELQNKTIEMLGLKGDFFVKYAENQVPPDQSAFKYILCNNLKLQQRESIEKTHSVQIFAKNQSQILDRGARLVQSVSSSEKQKQQKESEIPCKSPHTSGSQMITPNSMKKSNGEGANKQIARHNSMRQVFPDQQNNHKKSSISSSNSQSKNFRKLGQSVCSSQKEYQILVSSQNINMADRIDDSIEQGTQSQPTFPHFQGKHKTLASFARQLESQAMETMSINSSSQSDLMQFEELYIHFINEQNTRHYTIQCNREIKLLKAVQKIAKLQKVHVESILLFNFDLKLSINSNIKSCDVNKFIPDTMKVYEIADNKQRQHTILFRNRTLINKSFLSKIEKAMQNSDQVVENKENFNGINKLMQAKQLSRSVEMQQVCPNNP